MRTIYLHIGTPKTGTTAIQNFMDDNRCVMQTHHLLYPRLRVTYPGIGKKRNGHFLIDYYKKKQFGIDCKEYVDFWDDLLSQAKDDDDLVLSDEGIWKFTNDKETFWNQLHDFFLQKRWNLKVILYLRRQDLWLESKWAQAVKEGEDISFEKFAERNEKTRYPMDYEKALDQICGLFGQENVIVRVYEKEQYKGTEKNLYSDFLDIFGLEWEADMRLHKEEHNTSLSGNYLEMRRILNHLPELQDKKNEFSSALKEVQDQNYFPWDKEKTSYLDKKTREQLLAKYADSNEVVAKKYLGKESGSLFEAPVKDIAVFEMKPEQFLADMMLVYAKTIHHQEDMFKLQEKVTMLQKQEIEQLQEELKNSIEREKELRVMVRQLQRDSLWYRFKRKVKCTLGKGQEYI